MTIKRKKCQNQTKIKAEERGQHPKVPQVLDADLGVFAAEIDRQGEADATLPPMNSLA
jgi:hypothetical protein